MICGCRHWILCLILCNHIVSKVSPPRKSVFCNPLIDSVHSPPLQACFSPTWQTDIITFCRYTTQRIKTALGCADSLYPALFTLILCLETRVPPTSKHESHTSHLSYTSTALSFLPPSATNGLPCGLADLTRPAPRLRGAHYAARCSATANAVIQQVGIYHVQNAQIGLNSGDRPWLEMDGRWGSRPVATLATWESVSKNSEHVSHHVQTAALSGAQCPRPKYVSRLLEAILLVMSTC